MPKNMKVDLSLLKKLVAELDNSLSAYDQLKVGVDMNDSVIELSKATGLASGVMQEASLLMLDIQQVMRSAQSVAPASSSVKSDLLDKILGPRKGGKIN